MFRHGISRSRCALLTLLLAGCGSDSDLQPNGSAADGGGTPDNDNGATQNLALGYGSGSGFVAGAIDTGLPAGSILAIGESTTLSVSLVDQAAGNTLYTQPATIEFSSECAAAGRATLTPSATTASGLASVSYQAGDCVGTDTLSASVTLNGQTLSANATIETTAADALRLGYVGATSNRLALRGTHNSAWPDSVTLTFQALDANGAAVSGQPVQFSLSSQAGGLALVEGWERGVSDSNGEVRTQVQAGTVAGTFRVHARLDWDHQDDPREAITFSSEELVVAGGLPTQQGFSLAATTLNPWAYDYDGNTSEVTVRLRDRYGNYVPDGTQVHFRAEGGAIEPVCATVNGACSVEWRGQAPRPDDGRTTLLAFAMGEEDFTDANGNGQFDSGENLRTDVAEAFQDNDFDGLRDADEEFVDLNNNGVHDGGDGLYNGHFCVPAEQSAGVCSDALVAVWRQLELVMAGQDLVFEVRYDDANGALIAPTDSVDVAIGPVMIHVRATDPNGNIPPTGTTFEIDSENGQWELWGGSLETPNATAFGQTFTLLLSADPSEANDHYSGALSVTYTRPDGTSVTHRLLTVTDAPPSYTHTFDFSGALQATDIASGTIVSDTVDISGGASLTLTIREATYGLPAGTAVTLTTTNGTVQPGAFTVDQAQTSVSQLITLTPDDTPGSGFLRIEVTPPGSGSSSVTLKIDD